MAVLSVLIAREGFTGIRPLFDDAPDAAVMRSLGHEIGRSTVQRILADHGIEPAPEQGSRTSWATFLKAHWEVMAATDFFTIEVWSNRGLATYYVLFIIHLSTRSVHIAGVTTAPNGAFMKQVARNLTDVEDGFLLEKLFLIMDRDKKISHAFRDFGSHPDTCSFSG